VVFLALRVVRGQESRKSMWLVQDSYIEPMVERFVISTDPPAKTPPLCQELHTFDGTATPEQILGYQQRIGSCLSRAIRLDPYFIHRCEAFSISHGILAVTTTLLASPTT